MRSLVPIAIRPAKLGTRVFNPGPSAEGTGNGRALAAPVSDQRFGTVLDFSALAEPNTKIGSNETTGNGLVIDVSFGLWDRAKPATAGQIGRGYGSPARSSGEHNPHGQSGR
jgi:hypothetical protein